MKRHDAKILRKVVYHIRRHYPEVTVHLIKEAKQFYMLGFPYDQMSLALSKKFMQRRDFVRRVHGKGISKPFIFSIKHTRV